MIDADYGLIIVIVLALWLVIAIGAFAFNRLRGPRGRR